MASALLVPTDWSDWKVSFHAYQCSCVAGFANGVCEYEFITEYTIECMVMESENSTFSGNCDLDVDECASSPCLKGGTCTDSTVNASIPFDAFACECRDGSEGHICELDSDECLSSPCLNGASCFDSITDSTVPTAEFRCTCVRGYSGEICTGDFDECISHPCLHNGTCIDSQNNSNISIDAYACICGDIWEGANCGLDIDDCRSNPCLNNGTCFEGLAQKNVSYYSSAFSSWFQNESTLVCEDTPAWVDTDADGCEFYTSCQDGKPAPSVEYDQWAVNGVSAVEACCRCGGGTTSGAHILRLCRSRRLFRLQCISK